MEYIVKRVTSGRKLNDFLRLPYKIYQNDNNWVAPMISEVRRSINMKCNPYFSNASIDLFVCYKGNTPVSRVAIVMNKMYQKFNKVNKALFGFFESYNDTDATETLFSYIDDFCINKHIEIIEGPFNPNHYSEIGIKTDNFDCLPTFFETYNPEYYSYLLESSGYNISKKIHTRKNHNIKEFLHTKYGEIKSYNFKGYRVRSFSMKHFKQDLEVLRGINNDAFASNWNFLPVSKEEYIFSAKFLKLVTNPDLIKIVEYNNEPVGALQCVLDINPLLKNFNGKFNLLKYLRFKVRRKNIDKLIIYTVGIKKGFRGGRTFLLLLNEMCRMAEKFDKVETTWTTDSNILAVKASEALGLVHDKNFSMYAKNLNIRTSKEEN